MSPSPPATMDLGALAGLAPELANTFASLASDIALVIDADGVIRNAALSDTAVGRRADQWVGSAFVDTVTQDTRGKIESLLREVNDTGVSRRREVNLPGAGDTSIPVVFAAIRLGRDIPLQLAKTVGKAGLLAGELRELGAMLGDCAKNAL